jgi:uncharacterized protein YjbI with pentapeptide repeats
MRIVKPASLGLLPKPYRFRQQQHLAISALGFFPLGLSAERFLPEQFQWPLAMAALPPNEPLDFAMPKARGEMLLAASAYAVQAEPITRMTVRARLGGIDKSLLVTGDREWQYGTVPLYSLTDPKPFTEMPITYARAFGGPRYGANRLGVGYLGRRLPALIGANRGPAWNIEDPREPVRSARRRYAPAGFGPLDIRSAARQAKAGTYDSVWLRRDFPGLPEDLDWSLFNAAPPDQQIDGFFTGDEPYRLEGMHPAKAVIEGHLPKLRVRSFVHRKGTTAEDAQEIPMVCDTVWFFPAQELGVLIYRGRTAIQDSDALDVESVMLAYEAVDDAPRSLASYRQTLQFRVDPATAALHALNDAPLTPIESEARRVARAQRCARREADDLQKRQTLLDESVAEFWQKSGMQLPAGYLPPKVKPLSLPPITAEAIAAGDVDLVERMTQAKALADAARQQGKARLEDLALRKEVTPALATVPRSPDAGTQLEEALARASVIAHDLLGGPAGLLPPEFQQLNLDAMDEALRAKIRSAVGPLPALNRKARRASPQPLYPKTPLLTDVAARLGDVVRGWITRGECLAGRDLAGADLQGAPFSGADLREVLFERADLSHADFRGAQLQGAVFTAACLDDADFSGANLTEATLRLAHAQGARFRDARLDSATLTDACCDNADFSGASLLSVMAVKTGLSGALLVGCDLSRALLTQANAGGANFSNARFERSVLLGATLRRADFTGATLERTVLLNVAAEDSIWRGSRLTSVQAGGTASFVRADWSEMTARQCGWRGSDLRAADLRGSRQVSCDFGTCNLDGADLRNALLWRCLFMQASLRDCRLEDADFFQAMCRKSDLRGSPFEAARLTQADFSEALRGNDSPHGGVVA